jgi:hypothetical protein
MLARLVSARQVVVLCDNFELHLLYQGQAYSRPTTSGVKFLPKHSKTPYCPIWALIDVDFKGEGAPIVANSNVWPIQASSPNPVRWKFWAKQFSPALWGVSLWDMEELNQGCVFGFSPLSAFDPGHVVR